MTDKKITQLNNITGASLASGDEFVVVDISADETKAITRDQLFQSVPNILTAGNITGTAVTQSSTDLTDGRILRVQDAPWNQNNPPLLASMDAAPTRAGPFTTTSAGTVGTFPTPQTFGSGFLVKFGINDWCMYFTNVTDDVLFMRRYRSPDGGWKPWRAVYDNLNIVGTALFAGGVNTGAAFQYFTGPNGQTYRYADGRQVCTNNNAAITNSPAAFVGVITKLDSDKMWTGRWRT